MEFASRFPFRPLMNLCRVRCAKFAPGQRAEAPLLPCLTLAFMLGIFIADAGQVVAQVWIRAVLIALTACALAFRSASLREASAVLVFLAAGGLAQAQRLEFAAQHVPLRTFDQTVEGRVCHLRVRPGRITLDLCDVVGTAARSPKIPRGIRVHLELPRQLDGKDARLARLGAGQRLRMRLRLRATRDARNPGARDEAQRLARRGIGASATLVDPMLWVRLSERESVGSRLMGSLFVRIDCLRRRSAERLASRGPGHELIRTLVLGDRSGLMPTQRGAFARLGIAHLLAVSGLHVTLVVGLAFAGVRWALLRSPALAGHMDVRRPALVAALLVACAYGLLAGFGVPIQRALLFLLTAGLALRFGRGFSGVQVLSLAALPLLVREPYILFEFGAQLSFLASGALLLARGDTSGRHVSRILALLRTSATAIAGTAPVLAWHAAGSGVLGIATNLVAVPWVALVLLPVSVATLLLAWLPVPEALLRPGFWLAEATLWIITAMSDTLPDASAPHAPAIWWWLLGTSFAGFALLARGLLARVGWILAMGSAFAWASPATIEPSPPRLVGFDVGLGDAILIQGRTAAVLVDAGRALEPYLDLGRQVVVPGLAALGVTRLDLVVASHSDLDHRGGLPAVLEMIPVGEVWLPVGGLADRGFEALRRVARDRGVSIRERGSEDPAVSFGDLVVESLWPPRDGRPRSKNAASLLLRVTTDSGAGQRVLLPGDLGIEQEEALLRRGVDLRADVLKVGHHGSRSSSSAAFLAATAASHALLSAPCQGRMGLPTHQAAKALAAQGMQMLWTGREGAVLLGLGRGARVARGWAPRRSCVLY